MTNQAIEQYANGLDVNAVNPKNGAKYSPNLYRWLTTKGKKHRAWTSRIYKNADGVLFIGMMEGGDLIGALLIRVLCNGAKAESWCYTKADDMVEVADFWPRYMADGRCAIDTEHSMRFVGDDTRWNVRGDWRDCLWCGKAQQLMTRWTEVVERGQWRNVQNTGD